MRTQVHLGLGKDDSLLKACKFVEHSRQIELTKYSIVILNNEHWSWLITEWVIQLAYLETSKSRLGNETFCKGVVCDKSLNPGICRQCEGSLSGHLCSGKVSCGYMHCWYQIRSVVVFLGTKESLSNHSDSASSELTTDYSHAQIGLHNLGNSNV